ncbi:MAG: hypothetical protein ABN502_13905 [Gammaproteobacteria bacterium]
MLLPAFKGSSCPKLPIDSGYSVQGQIGPDYTICTLTPLKPGLLPAEIFVGGIWGLPDDSRFTGFSKTPVGHVAWFYGVRDGSQERMAFLPTGLDYPDSVLLVIHGGSLHETTQQRELLLSAVVRASMRPNNSFKPNGLRPSA